MHITSPFELSNDQRKYFGLEPIEANWERVILEGDHYRADSIIYFEGDIIKRHITSTTDEYHEKQYNELTFNRSVLLPKTDKGKEKKLTASVLGSRQPTGVYCSIDSLARVFIGNYNTQTTFYDTWWEENVSEKIQKDIRSTIEEFINTSSKDHLLEIEIFKNALRKLCKFKQGDVFAYKVSRTQYGFGRILADISLLKKKNLLSAEHGLALIMAKPVLVKTYAYLSANKNIDIDLLLKTPSLPSDYMMDNLLLYGQFEVIGNIKLQIEEPDLPMSYGRHIDPRRNSTFLQWGSIHKELPYNQFNKYLTADNPFVPENSPSRKSINPYGFYSIGFYPGYSKLPDIDLAINKGHYSFTDGYTYKSYFDLRNPSNKTIRREIMEAFGLDPSKNYFENCKLTGTADVLLV